MGLFKPKYTREILHSVEGTLPNIGGGMMLTITVEDDAVRIKAIDKNEVLIPYSQIRDVQYVRAIEEYEGRKSVVGRAVVGGLIFGPVGAVVGGIDGTGKKKKTKTRMFVLVTCLTSEGDEIEIPLEVGSGTSLKVPKVINEIRDKSGLEPIEVKMFSDNPSSSSVTI